MSRSEFENSGQRRRRQDGFVLLLVLSALGLLAIVAASFSQIARTHVRAVAVASETARAEAAADAGVHLAILDLVAARDDEAARRLALDATPFSCSMDSDEVTLTIAVQDEAGKVDLNIGGEPLLRALALGAGVASADAVVDAILDYRDADDDRRVSGAERTEYIAAGRPNGPRNAPFLAVEELGSVLGITQTDVDRLRPFLTIYSGLPAIDVNVASGALIETMNRGIRLAGGPVMFDDPSASDHVSNFGFGAPLPRQYIAASTRRAFSVHSEARTAGGTIFVREAVVEFVATTATAFLLRRWYRGTAAAGASSIRLPC